MRGLAGRRRPAARRRRLAGLSRGRRQARHGPHHAGARSAAPLWGIRLDGGLFAQPLVVQGLVIVATEHDSVYAFDAVTACQAWRTSLGAAFDVRRHKLRCNNIEPELGITATPAVDPLTATVYVVAFLDPGRYEMDTLDLGGVGGQAYTRALSGGCYAIGTTAYRAPLVFVPCDHSLTAVRVDGTRFDVAWRGHDFRSGSPIVAGGLVWDYDFEGGLLWAFDPGSGVVRQRVAVGIGQHFASLASSAGRLYVPAQHSRSAFAI